MGRVRRRVQRARTPASRGRRRGARARRKRMAELVRAAEQRGKSSEGPAPDVLFVVGLGLGDTKDNTVKGLWPCMGPFDAFDSAVVGHGRSQHAAQTTKVARGR